MWGKVDRIALAVFLCFAAAWVIKNGASTEPPSLADAPATDAAEITDWNWKPDLTWTTDHGIIKWNVQVRNKSSQNIRSVQVDFVTYDRDGRLVSSTYAFVHAIPPGESRATSSFADFYTTEANATVQISEVYFSGGAAAGPQKAGERALLTAAATGPQKPGISQAKSEPLDPARGALPGRATARKNDRPPAAEPKYGDTPVADVTEVVDWNWRPEPAFAGTGAILWDVQLRNTSSQAIRAVTVKFFAYDANGNRLTTDEAWVISIPPGEVRSGKGYADLHGTEATATIQVQDFNFDSKEMAPFEQWVIDEQLANRRIDHFCRVEQAYKEKLAITEKSLKQRWPNDQDCRDGYKMQACLWSNASKAKPSEIAFMDSCKRTDMRPPQDPKTQEALCQLAYPKTPMWKEAIAGAKRCTPLITPTIAPAYRTWSRGTFE